MEEAFALTADPTPIELDASGLTIVAPGLIGTGRCHPRRIRGESRDFALASTELERAIAEAGLDERHTLELEAQTPTPAAGASRGFGDVADDELLLQVPLARDEAALVLYTDEAGRISIHYGEVDAASPALPTRAFGAHHRVRFRLRLRSGISRQAGTSRGLLGSVVAKVIKVLVVKLLAVPAGQLVAGRVAAWEARARVAQGLHGGTSTQLLEATPLPLANPDLLQGGRALLFIHGTTSSTAGAFAGLRQNGDVLERLYAAYEGRVVGFNHHTMSVPVIANARDLLAALAPAPGDYHFDIVCHSRGGLVARALAHLDADTLPRPPGVNVRVGRIVFVATPNAGTPLADPERLPGFVERLVNVVNLLPDSGLTIAAGALLSLAAAIVEAGLPKLPGLADQAPGSALQHALEPPPGGIDGFHAFASDYEPSGNLIDVVKNRAVDRIFEAVGNDLVVPTGGVALTPYFELPAERVFVFARERAVHHSLFFSQPEMGRLPVWLGVD
ncbi:MAG: alpha/beta hydrolase [Caldimonas sp.]